MVICFQVRMIAWFGGQPSDAVGSFLLLPLSFRLIEVVGL